MSTALPGTKEQLDDLAEEFGANHNVVDYPIQYDATTETYYREVEGENGIEYEAIEEKYYPIIARFIY